MSPPTRVAPPRPPATRPPRSRRATVIAAVLALVVLAGAAVYLVAFTAVLGVDKVTVTGVRALSADQVRTAAAIPAGRPLARLDTGTVADRVRALPGVERVAVTRAWPGTVRITVTERHGVALVRRDGAYWLVDPDGVVFQRLTAKPKLPLLSVTDVRPESEPARAALTALRALPGPLLGAVSSVQAATPEQVTLKFNDGRTVFWGGADASAAKASVLAALLRRPGTYLDVSTPSVVTVR